MTRDPPPAPRALRRGDRGAFSRWMTGWERRVYAFVARRLGDPEAALDVLQETFLAAYRGLDRLPRAPEEQAGWLFGIARHKAADDRRRRGRQRAREAPLPDATPGAADPAALATARHELGGVRTALEAVPPPYKEALVLATVDGLSYAEVAAAQGCPVGTVKSRVAKARQLLRAELARSEPTGGTPC